MSTEYAAGWIDARRTPNARPLGGRGLGGLLYALGYLFGSMGGPTVAPAGYDRRGRIVWVDEAGGAEFSPTTQRRIQLGSAIFLALFALLAIYSVLALQGIVPLPSWSAAATHGK